MSDLFLIRHGPTHLKSMVGWSDVQVDLSDTAKLARLHAQLPKDGYVVSSDLRRAIETADALHLPQTRLPHDTGLRELNFGDWELKTFQEIDRIDHDRVFSFYDNPGETRAPKGESWNCFCARVNTAVDRLMTSYPNFPLVIVCHFGVVMSQLQRAEGNGAKHAMRHQIDNLSLTHLSNKQGIWSIHKINFRP